MAILVRMQMRRKGRAMANSGSHRCLTRLVPAFGIFFIKLSINIHVHVNTIFCQLALAGDQNQMRQSETDKEEFPLPTYYIYHS